jgi:hypothetical protein
MKYNINYWINFQKWIRIISSFVLFFIILVLYADAKIILKNNYELTNNKMYLIILFILMILYWNYR